MKKKLFENVGGNQFKLLTESFDAPEGTKLMREGLKKVFAAHKTVIPYKVLTNVGLGYIKSVTEAVKYALLEAQNLAPSFGFKDDEANQRFVKEDGEMSSGDIADYENGRPMVGTRPKSMEASSGGNQILAGYMSDQGESRKFQSGDEFDAQNMLVEPVYAIINGGKIVKYIRANGNIPLTTKDMKYFIPNGTEQANVLDKKMSR